MDNLTLNKKNTEMNPNDEELLFFSKIYAVFSGKFRYAWDQFFSFGAGKYRGKYNLIAQCSNYMLVSLENEPYISHNNIVILILGKIRKSYIDTIEQIFFKRGHQETIQYLKTNPPDCTLVLFNGNNNLPICLGYCSTKAHPIYICNKNEKNSNIVCLSSEVKCMSSKFDNSKKQDELIYKIPNNNVFLIEYNNKINKISYNLYPTVSNDLSLNKYILNNPNYLKNLIIFYKDDDIYLNIGNKITILDNFKVRTSIYFMESNNAYEIICKLLIENYINSTKDKYNISEILCIGDCSCNKFKSFFGRIFKIFSRNNIFIEQINNDLFNNLPDSTNWLSIKTFCKNYINIEDLTKNCNDIFNEFYGQINNNISFDERFKV